VRCARTDQSGQLSLIQRPHRTVCDIGHAREPRLAEVVLRIERLLLQIGQQHVKSGPMATILQARAGRRWRGISVFLSHEARRKGFVRTFVTSQSQPYLLEVVLALCDSRAFASLLNCRKQKCQQDPHDRDHNQQLNQREASRSRLRAAGRPTQSSEVHDKWDSRPGSEARAMPIL